jgi:hypothetical protein
MTSGFVTFNDSSSSLIGFQTLGINWDYQNVGGKPTRNLRVRTTGTNNPTALFHYDNPGFHTFNSFTSSAPSSNDKDDLIFEWSNPSNGDIPQSDILHVGLELDVWDWTVDWARVGHPDGTETHATLLSFHEWSNTVEVGTLSPGPTSDPINPLAKADGVVNKAAEDGLSYQDSLDMGPPQRVLARGIRIVAPDIPSTVFNLALADVTGRDLTLADLNQNTFMELQNEEALEYIVEFQERTIQSGEDFIIVLDGNEPGLPAEILEKENFLILNRPDLLEGEVFVSAQSKDEAGTIIVGNYALLGGPLNGRPEIEERPIGLRLGFNEEITNNTGQDAYDFHLEGTLKSETLPAQVIDIILDWPRGSIPGFDWTYDGGNITHAGGEYYNYSGKWSGSVPVPPGHQVHIGKAFNVSCSNVFIRLRGWWTDRNGEKINPDAGTEVCPGIWVSDVPLLGFDIRDNIPARLTDPNLPQTVTLQNATDMDIEITSPQLAVTDRNVPLEELVPDSNLLSDLDWRDIPNLPPFSVILPGESWTFDLHEMDMAIQPGWTTVIRTEIWDPVSGEYHFYAGKCQAHLVRNPFDPGNDGLVAYYQLENNVLDSSGNELHGTIVGDPVFAEGPAGYGMALDFDGVDDYVDCGNDTLFDITDAFTLSVWINWRATGATWQTVIAKGDNAWRLARGGDTQTLDFGFTDGGARGWLAARTDSEVALREWHNVTAIIDTKDGAKIYLDGVLEGTNLDTGGITVGSYPVLLGENAQAVGRFWDGLIDEVMIYNRALSEDEVWYLAGLR